ncbi:MAG: mechanosensitive ion channel [Burkholderiaceae bacterium]|nr:mechanosensitive ion channel [Burkholderiaceae bacterium]MEB2320806.1 mechanosensitive ion channel [Pseudomonadota bacterium]
MNSNESPIEATGALLRQLRVELADGRLAWQLVAIAICVGLAWLLARRFAHWRRRRATETAAPASAGEHVEAPVVLAEVASMLDEDPGRLGELTVAAAEQRAADAALVARERHAPPAPSPLAGVVFPISLYLLLAIAIGIVGQYQSTGLLRLALLLSGALAAVRLLGFLLGRLSSSPSVRAVERGIAIAVGAGVVLHLFGHLEPLAEALGAMRLPFGSGELSLLQLLRSVFWLGLTILVAFWLGSLLESRLLRFDAIDISLRTVLARLVRAVLLLVAVLLGLSVVGIDVTALSVFGGALGVGIGLGLQRIASNYVSGLIILLERSVRPGDSIRIGTLAGSITAIRTRYSVLRASDGVEIIVPNEFLTSQTVHNVTTGGRLRHATRLQIAYGCDPEQVIGILLGAIRANPQVLADPAPTARVTGFGAAGLEFEFAFHVSEPSPGGNVGSDVNRAVYMALRAAGLEIKAA